MTTLLSLSCGPAHLSALDEAAIVATTDVRGTIVHVNDKFCAISGYGREELVGANHRIVRSGHHPVEFFRAMYRTIARGETWHGEICNRRKTGEIYWVDTTIVPRLGPDGRIAFYDSIRFDITPLKAAEERLWHEANTDYLTGLWNRSRFSSELTERIGRGGRPFLFALMDVDGFKDLNDIYGHDAGDEVLRTLARRLADLCAGRASLARLGGDEFCFWTDEAVEPDTFPDLVEDAILAMRAPVTVGGAERRLGASFGIARFPDDGTTTGALLKNADIALYRAKSEGRDRAVWFTEAMAESEIRRSRMVADAIRALKAGEFELHYQPIAYVDADLAQVVGLEALLRWHHPELGLLTAERFAAAFERPSFSVALTDWVIGRAVEQTSRWAETGQRFDTVFLNVCGPELRDDGLSMRLLSRVRNAGLEPGRFAIEVHEEALYGRGNDKVVESIRRLAAMGFKIYFDDFGTGYASLAQLKALPITGLKIDRAFIAEIAADSSSQAIVRGLVGIATSLGLDVIAEGVETEAQLRAVNAEGIRHVQGYLLGRPRAAAAIAEAGGALERVSDARHR